MQRPSPVRTGQEKGSDPLVLDEKNRGLGSIADADLAENALQLGLHGLTGDVQAGRDLGVGEAVAALEVQALEVRARGEVPHGGVGEPRAYRVARPLFVEIESIVSKL